MARKQNKKSNKSVGCLFWIAVVLLVIVIFLFNRSRIQEVLKETGFIELISPEEEAPEVERIRHQEQAESPAETPEEQESAPASEKPEPQEPISIEVEEPQPDPPEDEKDTPVIATPQKIRKSTIYFVEVDTEGEISLKGIVRPVYYQDSPLTKTMETLMLGLSSSELNMGLISLIPDGTVLKGVSVKEGTAFIDFSEEFRFNPFGAEGHMAQLKQVVYTVTEFNSVDRVQFLVEGRKIDYMGPEGIYVGAPLERGDF